MTPEDVIKYMPWLFISVSVAEALLPPKKPAPSKDKTPPALKDKIIISIGGFDFYADRSFIDSMTRTTTYPWKKIERIKNTPAWQATGLPEVETSVAGTIYSTWHKTGLNYLDGFLSSIGEAMKPVSVVTGFGTHLYYWVILECTEEMSDFLPTGEWIVNKYSIKMARGDINGSMPVLNPSVFTTNNSASNTYGVAVA